MSIRRLERCKDHHVATSGDFTANSPTQRPQFDDLRRHGDPGRNHGSHWTQRGSWVSEVPAVRGAKFTALLLLPATRLDLMPPYPA
ncbi:unnamed protein product [Lota lota]